MARYFLEVMYDGTAFHGSQLQGELPTVQLAINNTLSTLFKTKIESFGASRTDEGVHALANYYHFDTEQELHKDFPYKMNAILPRGIAVENVYKAADDNFNARFDAISRKYRYRIYAKKDPFLFERALFYPFRLQTDLLRQTAEIIKEYNDFESFCKRNSQVRTYKCNIMTSQWEQRGEELHYIVEANRFLRGMVRGLVATQLRVARGQCSIENFRDIIDAKDCTKAYFNVAGHGLYLEQIAYPSGALELLKFK
ncbi:MAG: tRNA pseudouridine(38-40) synthase TruA [Bacteroidetes bacterium]|nr:tRNA pseudouridine(38-40) synthase TruA [Bacteroidota bacterium]